MKKAAPTAHFSNHAADSVSVTGCVVKNQPLKRAQKSAINRQATKGSEIKNILFSKASAYSVTDHVSRAANGMKQRPLETLVDLGAQPRNMHVNDIGLRIEVIIPDVFQQHGARDHLARMLHQIFQKAEFARLQCQLILATHHAVREPVELQITDAVGGVFGRATAAARQHLDPGEQLREGI